MPPNILRVPQRNSQIGVRRGQQRSLGVPGETSGPGRLIEPNEPPPRFVVSDLYAIATGNCYLGPVRMERQMRGARVEFPLSMDRSWWQRIHGNGSIRTPDGDQPAVAGEGDRPHAVVRVTGLAVHEFWIGPVHQPDPHAGARPCREVLAVRRQHERPIWKQLRNLADFDVIGDMADGDAACPVGTDIAS